MEDTYDGLLRAVLADTFAPAKWGGFKPSAGEATSRLCFVSRFIVVRMTARTKPLVGRTLRVYKFSYAGGVFERLTGARYDDANMDSAVSSISMSINN